MSTPTEQIEELKDQVAKLQAFKEYVHQRLDEAGIPIDPPGEHADAGCRVGQRLDIALRSPTHEEPVAWTTQLALDVSVANRGISLEMIDGCARNLWGEKGIPLYTHPRPKPAPVLTVEQVERLRSFVVASPATSASMSKRRREILEWINMLTTTP